MFKPPKFLICNLTIGSSITTFSWNASITGLVYQQHPGYTSDITGRKYKNAYDVVEGDYITTTSSGKCLKITSITNQIDVGFDCVLVDELEVNKLFDPNGDPKIASGKGYIFEIKNNLPVLFPLPSGLEAGFNYTFASQLLSRFISVYGVGAGADALTTANLGNTVASLDAGKKLQIAQLPASVVITTDPRLTDARTPLTHTHTGYVASTDARLTDARTPVPHTHTEYVATTDSRLTDARTPLTHTHTGYSSVYTFRVDFSGANPGTISEVPTGWTITPSGSYVNVSHNVGKMPKIATYLGYNSGNYYYRFPTLSDQLLISEATKNIAFSFSLPNDIAGSQQGGHAYVTITF